VVGLPEGIVPMLSIISPTTQMLYGASGRFIGNGYDQMVFAATSYGFPVRQITFQAIGAVDPNNTASGIRVGAAALTINNASTIYAMTSGVFTDALAGEPPPNAQIAVLSGNPTNGTGLTLSLYSVTSNLTIVPGATLNLSLGSDGSGTLPSISIASGRFSGGNHDQIVVAYAGPNPSNPAMSPVKLVTIDFTTAGVPVQRTTYDSAASVQDKALGGPSAVLLQPARFDWFGNSAQVALSTFSYLSTPGNYQNGTGQIQIIQFDAALNASSGPAYSTSGEIYHYATTAGRFDRMQANPIPPPATEPNPNLQLADVSVYTAGRSSQIIEMNLYNVDPATLAISKIWTSEVFPYQYVPSSPTGFPSQAITLNAADMQGRSVAIGPPEKATITGHIQPDLILGLPPMHVDWITPAEGGAAKVQNVSVYPQSFNTEYTFETNSGTSSSITGTTSYTGATKQIVGAKISYGFPGAGGISIQASKAWEQMHKKTVAAKYNTYSGLSTAFSTNTIFDDVVAASSSQMNIYSYRVIGQCSTAAGAAASEGCAAGTLPVYVQFSGPDNFNYIPAVLGSNVEWYQPVQEPGNLFSYPANAQQLEANLAGGTTLQPLTPTNQIWDAQVTSEFTADWKAGGGSSVTSGTTASHSVDAQVSVSANASVFGFDVGASTGFAYNKSTSVGTLNQSTSSFLASKGIVLARGIGGHNVNSEYDYAGQSIIYGQTPPPGTIQSDISSATTVQGQGYLAAAHLTDMLSMGTVTSGNWWRQVYTSAPDLALNHPQRWSQHEPTGFYDQEVWFNCPVDFSSSGTSPSCTSYVPAACTADSTNTCLPAAIADAPFYYMKGLFVTPGDTNKGPQITSTTAGSKVNLRVRVYNYSLSNFLPGTVTHVQFYAQPWGSEGAFVSAPGNPNEFAPAIFLGEGTDASGNPLAPAPAFCGGVAGGSGSDDPCLGSGAAVQNWEFAYATWDTSKGNIAPNSSYKFWVVVWAEYNGKLVEEISGHGLSSIPATPFRSLAAVPVETYSNNLGFYNQVFTVFPPAGTATGSSKPAPYLKLSSVELRRGATATVDQPIAITATETSSGADIHSVLTLYYDGDPAMQGTLFDTQTVDRVSSRGFVDTARFNPQTCGAHRIFVHAIPNDGSAKETTAETTIDVTMDSMQEVQAVGDLINYLGKLNAPPDLHSRLYGYLVAARDDFKQGQTESASRALVVFQKELKECAEGDGNASTKKMLEQVGSILECVRQG
jgi:hypothetical protein